MQLRFERGSHICHLCEGRNDQKAVVLPFLKGGLRLGERCTLITSDLSVDDWYFELQAYEIDVFEEGRKGTLEVLEGTKCYLEGEFNSLVLARQFWQMIESSLPNATGVRIVADMTWTLGAPLSIDQLCHWEATANLVFADTDARAICQYDIRRHPPAALHSALRTHPIVIFEGRARHNPFYEAQDILDHEPYLNGSDADAGKIEEMLTTLRNA